MFSALCVITVSSNTWNVLTTIPFWCENMYGHIMMYVHLENASLMHSTKAKNLKKRLKSAAVRSLDTKKSVYAILPDWDFSWGVGSIELFSVLTTVAWVIWSPLLHKNPKNQLKILLFCVSLFSPHHHLGLSWYKLSCPSEIKVSQIKAVKHVFCTHCFKVF